MFSEGFMDILIFAFEIIGTVAFSVSGAMTGLKKNMDIFGVMILGVVTAIGGGVLRDVLAGEKPYIFVKHIYACASIAGSVACVIIWRFNSTAAVIAGAAIVFVVRLLAAHFRWSLPKADRFGPALPQEQSENDENTQEI